MWLDVVFEFAAQTVPSRATTRPKIVGDGSAFRTANDGNTTVVASPGPRQSPFPSESSNRKIASAVRISHEHDVAVVDRQPGRELHRDGTRGALEIDDDFTCIVDVAVEVQVGETKNTATEVSATRRSPRGRKASPRRAPAPTTSRPTAPHTIAHVVNFITSLRKSRCTGNVEDDVLTRIAEPDRLLLHVTSPPPDHGTGDRVAT
jgi:hypothetical protein